MIDPGIATALVSAALCAWEWRAFRRLDAQAARTMLPVFRRRVAAEVWTLLWSGDPWGYKTRRHGDGQLLVRPVSALEHGPSAGPFLFALARVTGSRETAQLTAYLPSGPLLLMALVVLLSFDGGWGGAIWGVLVLSVSGLGLATQLSEVKLCFGRLERLAIDGAPLPLPAERRAGSGNEQG